MIRINSLTKKYGNKTIFNNLNLRIKKGEFISILGKNGSGKTTLLNLISGIDKNYDGQINIHNNSNIDYIFQNSDNLLLPWKTITENIYLANNQIDEKRLNNILNEFGLIDYKDKYPYELSGGMKQILAIARSLILKKNILLLDEPFSALDYTIKERAIRKLRKFWLKNKITIIFVSHNINDALLLSNRIIILKKETNKVSEIKNLNFNMQYNEIKAIYYEKYAKYKEKIRNIIENDN